MIINLDVSQVPEVASLPPIALLSSRALTWRLVRVRSKEHKGTRQNGA